MSDNKIGYLYGALSSASYGVNALAVILYAAGLSTNSVLFYRYSLATLLVAAMMRIRRVPFHLSRQELLWAAPMGVLFALSSWTLFESYRYIGVSLAATILFVYPIMVALLMWLLFRETPKPVTLVAIPVIFGGVALLNHSSAQADYPDAPTGIAIVLASGLCYSLYMVGVQKSCLARMHSLKLSFYSLLFGTLVPLTGLRFGLDLQPLHGALQMAVALALALFPSVVSLTAMASAIRLVGSTATAVMGAFEPITSVLFGVALFAERPTASAWIGMALILLSVTAVVGQHRLSHIGGRLANGLRFRHN